MEPLIVLAVTFLLLWVLFILPQQRRVRAHQALVASVQPGDEVILSAGIHGRIVELGPEELMLEVAPGVELRVARQAVLRLVEDATVEGAPGIDDATGGATAADDDAAAADHGAAGPGAAEHDAAVPGAETDGPAEPRGAQPEGRGPATPGPDV
jgi:preprotein translocase subunit YajC